MMATSKGRWTNDEHERYVEGLKRFGPDFKKLSSFIQTRKATQIRYYHRRQHGRFQEKAMAKDAAAVASKAAASIVQSTSQSKKRGIEDDGAATEAKKKVKVATEEETASGSPPLTAKVRAGDMLAVPSPKLTPTLVPVRDPATEVEQKPAAIPLPEIDEIPPSMKSPIKLAPKSIKIDADDNVHEDGTNDSPKTSETKKEEEIDIDVGGGNVLAPVAGGGCPLKFVNSLLQKEYVQCILGGVLGFLALQVVKMIIP